ncbi:helix-turn-helix domain-containing protein [Streptomyces sp. NBC_00582]|uniref:helix-turn-helix domain-containing protein n=1 Tax=Streptomyces sp. NBC_00582 TaxID=2975783 RepID=UPI002E812F71|nr:helix-turn-helix domain-containing protein [Streptomyces sp. NBC_00582]WUB60043.1 helix-turn-helix domain-containing protein [Streptomyces sp. NBC_00582]
MRAEDLPAPAGPGDPSPPPGLVVAAPFDEPAGYGVNRPGGSDSWLFTWTTGGRGRLRQGASEVRAGPGDLVVLAPGVPHSYGVEPGAPHWRFWWAHCQARPSWTPWLRPYGTGDGLYAVTPVPTALHGRVEAAFRRLYADARWTGGAHEAAPETSGIVVAHGAAARELALCALEEAVLLTTAAARPPLPRPGLDERVRRVQAILAADPGAPHTVGSLAARVALSPSRLSHLFAEQTGQSPMRALREARLRHAARLLEGTGLSVERVAAASGFASPFHFTRVFRERYGSPPGAYRDGMRATIDVRGNGPRKRRQKGTPIPGPSRTQTAD